MAILGPLLLIVIACFGFVLAFGPPYLPTLSKSMKSALEVADMKPGERLLELGCGDGKVLIAAAKQGVHAVGFELNPLLVLLCKVRCWRYRHLVKVQWANFWTQPWPPTDVIFVFGLPRIMNKLDKKIVQDLDTTVKLVSFAFPIPNRKPVSSKDGVYEYIYHQEAKA